VINFSYLTCISEKEINIYVGLTEVRKWYRSVLEKDIDAVNGGWTGSLSRFFYNFQTGLTGKKGGKTRLMNTVMQVYIRIDMLIPISIVLSASQYYMSSVSF
jgi:hypothetical protein